jgi:orsellinic acid C2-O-methyltransferase
VHDWNDEHAQLILQTCRRDMPPAARLLLIERVMPERLTSSAEDRVLAQTDLNMLAALGAYERTRAEYLQLLAASGFASLDFHAAGSAFSLIEAAPVPARG